MTVLDVAFPAMDDGSRVMIGPVMSWFMLGSTCIVFFGQAMFAAARFQARKDKVSKFYATLIVLNITAMGLVTGPMLLHQVLPVPPFGGAAAYTDYTAPAAKVVIQHYVLLAFSIHSINNCCRLAHDAFGPKAAWQLMPFAWLAQAWLTAPTATGAFSFGMGLMILSLVDYVQHLAGLAYWSWYVARVQNRERERRCIYGVLLHMASIIPYVSYVNSCWGLDYNESAHGAVFTIMVAAMFFSQWNWIAAAELTPPEHTPPEHTPRDKSEGDDECSAAEGM